MDVVREQLKKTCGKTLRSTSTGLPTYLKTLLKQDGVNIWFLYSDFSEALSLREDPEKSDRSQLLGLDLTGTPLETDLEDGQDIPLDNSAVTAPSWTAQEAQQYPLSLGQARKCMNDVVSATSKVPVYCICDGADKKRTVVLGAQNTNFQFMRTLVFILPCTYESFESYEQIEAKIKVLRSEHIKCAKGSLEIEYFLTRYFYLYGNNLRNCHALKAAEHHGSVGIEVGCNPMHEKSDRKLDVKVDLQVIVGHPQSAVHRFWQELCKIHKYFELLNNPHLIISDRILLCEENTESRSIVSEICDVLGTVVYEKREEYSSLNLNKLRREEVTDKLWNLFKTSYRLSDLQANFHVLLEELAAILKNFDISQSNQSNIANLIRGISEGKLAVTPLTLSQSLEFLIELGLEKLKEDYCTIISKVHPLSYSVLQNLNKKWSELNSAKVDDQCKRKTKAFVKKDGQINQMDNNQIKFAYLTRMHVIVEFMWLSKDFLKLSEDNYDKFCDALYTRYLTARLSKNHFKDCMNLSLEEISLGVHSNDAKIISKNSPVAWLLKMSTKRNTSEVTTYFHFSEYPVFPGSIFSQYEIRGATTDGKLFYTTRAERYVDMLR